MKFCFCHSKLAGLGKDWAAGGFFRMLNPVLGVWSALPDTDYGRKVGQNITDTQGNAANGGCK
jgi:hypothetical protein